MSESERNEPGREYGRPGGLGDKHDGASFRRDPAAQPEPVAEPDVDADELARLLGGTPFDELELDAELRDLDLEDDELPDDELSERELAQRRLRDETDWAAEAERVYDELLARTGEAQPEPRLDATRRACELLGDVHEGWAMVHITGTNGKSSTARITEALVRAYGLRTGLLTSPHLVRVNERICINGEPVSDEQLATVWRDIEPIIGLVDAELERADKPALTFFEALTVLAYACFTDATIDVGIVEVGMGGEWDSTNVSDADVAVFAPISLDHRGRLGDTIAEIARTKAGIIKPGSTVVSAAQPEDAAAELRRAAELLQVPVKFATEDFAVLSDKPAVGGRYVAVRGTRAEYAPQAVRLLGSYQADNVALAMAAVEQLLDRELNEDALAEGLLEARSPGRLELIGTEPSVVVDACHNPHAAAHLAEAMREVFSFDELVLVLGVLADKDVAGIVPPLAEVATRIIVTQSDSPRAIDAWQLAEQVREVLGDEVADRKQLTVIERDVDAFDTARQLAAELGVDTSSGVLITGSITLIGDAVAIAQREGWRAAAAGEAPLVVGPTATDEEGEA